MEILKLFNIGEVIAQIVSFLLVLFLLRIFAWERILKLLDQRREKISSEFKKIEDTKLEIVKIKSEYEAKFDSVDSRIKEMIEEAGNEGKKITAEMKKSAYLEAQKIINAARQEIKYELSQAKEELKEKIIDLAIQAAERVIEEKLSEKQDRKLIEKFLDNIEQMD